MSATRLRTIVVDETRIQNLEMVEVILWKRHIANRLIPNFKETVFYKEEFTEQIDVRVSSTFGNEVCSENETSFAKIKETRNVIESEGGVRFVIIGSVKYIRDVLDKVDDVKRRILKACNSSKNETDIKRSNEHVKTLSFTDEFDVPILKNITITGRVKRMIGRIPFKLTYELTPPVNLLPVVKLALQYFRMADSVEISQTGTVHAVFNGVIDVNLAYDFDVETAGTNLCVGPKCRPPGLVE